MISGFLSWNAVVSSIASINSFSLYLILSLAFIIGMLSFFSPCGLAIMPAFISYNMAMADEGNAKVLGLKIGIFSALGVITFYTILGIFFSLFGAVIAPYLRILRYMIAILLIFLGIMLIRRISVIPDFLVKLRLGIHSRIENSSGFSGFYLFGFAYGIDIIGCLFPVVAALILIPILTGEMMTGVMAFLSYSLGLAVMMSVFAYLSVYSKKELVDGILNSAGKIKTVSGLGLVAGGVLLLIYYAFFEMSVGW